MLLALAPFVAWMEPRLETREARELSAYLHLCSKHPDTWSDVRLVLDQVRPLRVLVSARAQLLISTCSVLSEITSSHWEIQGGRCSE